MAENGSFFQVDLGAMSDSISQISSEREGMASGIQALRSTISDVEAHWVSPAGTTFSTLATSFNSTTDRFMSLLDDAIGRMNTVHQNYVNMETTNSGNLQ